MIERDLSRLRFLCTRVGKGEILQQDDIAFILDKRAYLRTVVETTTEALETLRGKYEEL